MRDAAVFLVVDAGREELPKRSGMYQAETDSDKLKEAGIAANSGTAAGSSSVTATPSDAEKQSAVSGILKKMRKKPNGRQAKKD